MPHRLNLGLLYAGLAVATIAVTVALKLWPPSGLAQSAIAYGLIIAALLAFAVASWRAMDEAAREAHKTAWFWGGGVGAGLAGWLVALIEAPGANLLALLPAPENAGGYLGYGVMMTLLLQLAGFAVVWAGWWLSKR